MSVRRELGCEPDAQVIGSIGRIEPQKRFDILIDAVAALLPKHPRLRLVIAGAGGQSAFIERYAATHLPPGRCRFLGHREDVITAASRVRLLRAVVGLRRHVEQRPRGDGDGDADRGDGCRRHE